MQIASQKKKKKKKKRREKKKNKKKNGGKKQGLNKIIFDFFEFWNLQGSFQVIKNSNYQKWP